MARETVPDRGEGQKCAWPYTDCHTRKVHPSPALDEERLSKAMQAVGPLNMGWDYPEPSRFDAYAKRVAAEYASLSEPPQEPERPTP